VDGELRFLHAALQDEGIAEDQQLLHLIWRSGRSPQEVARALQMPLRRVKQGMRSSIDAMIASHEA